MPRWLKILAVRFLIDSSVTGTPKHLLSDGGLSWVDEVPEGVLRWTSSCDTDADDSLQVALRLSGHEVKWKFEPKYVEAICAVIPNYRFNRNVVVPWHQVAPPHFAADAIRRLVADIERVVPDTDFDYYRDVFVRQTSLFRALQPACVDRERLERYITEEKSGGVRAGFLEKFRPGEDGMLPRVSYNRLHLDDSGTKTGRLTVSDGPDYLTLNREYRDILKSRWRGGSVWYLDYSSLEPRVFQAHLGRSISADFYASLAGEILGDSGRAADAKAMFLRRFYGAGTELVAEVGTSSHEQAKKFAKRVDEDFGVKEMTVRLAAEFATTGKIRNRFGRALRVEKGTKPHVLFNNWVQSTATDAALLGFAKACRAIEKANISVAPLCVIHDALVIDVHPACEKYVPVLAKVAAAVPESGGELLVHAERISHDTV